VVPATSRVGKGAYNGCDDNRQPDPGRIDPEREWPHHHLLQRARAVAGSGSGWFGAFHFNAVQTDGNGNDNSIVYLQTATIADTLNAIDLASGVQTAANTAGVAAFPSTRARRYHPPVVSQPERHAEAQHRYGV